MYTIYQTGIFSKWLHDLKDIKAKVAIARRIERAKSGNLGDVKPVGENISEMRFWFGPGYRVYFTEKDGRLIFLLCGGDKSTQQRDIAKAIKIAKEIDE